MKHLSRPYYHLLIAGVGVAAICAIAAGLAIAPPAAQAQAQVFAPIFEEPSPLAIRTSPAGYLGVDVADVDTDKAQSLKLKDVRGAVITLIDHDAPAGQVGLKVNDVVLAVNGQIVEGAEALRRMLREIPPGRKISLEISRDGDIQTLAVQLVDRKAMEHDVWYKLLNVEPGPVAPAAPTGMGVLSGANALPPGGFHMSLFTSTLNVGAMVEPLTSQMAEYFGVQSGLMVKQVARKSEAATAGFKAFDVILKVGADPIATSADWDRALRSNEGKPVQVTILRNKKQQTLTLQVDSKHHGALEMPEMPDFFSPSLFGPDSDVEIAELSPLFDENFTQALSAQAAADANAAAEAARAQADALKQELGDTHCPISQEQMEKLRQQAEKLRESMKDFKISPEQMQQLQQQTEKLRESMKDFKIDPEQMKQFQQQAEKMRETMKNFQIDPKEMEQLRQQMEEFRKNFNSDEMKQFQQQMEQFRQQMQQWQQGNCANCV